MQNEAVYWNFYLIMQENDAGYIIQGRLQQLFLVLKSKDCKWLKSYGSISYLKIKKTCSAFKLLLYIRVIYLIVRNRWRDMRAVMTPVATPRAKDPLKTPRKMPKDFNMAMASKLWLLSPAGWYATMELKSRQTRKHAHIQEKRKKAFTKNIERGRVFNTC